jgi:hypothetical protein
MRAPTKQNYDPVARRSADFLRSPLELRNKGWQDTQTALNVLRRRLDTISAKVSRLELRFQKQRVLLRREIAEAGIIGAVLMLFGLLGFSLVSRLL